MGVPPALLGETPAPALIVGMGNPILCDDGVGLRLARDAGARLAVRAGVADIVECETGGLNLLDVIAGRDRVVVLDSIRTHDGDPGAWYRFTAAALRETMNLNNVHDANFATSLELGRRIGMRLPRDEEIHVFAVEVRDTLTFSERLSEEVERAYPDLREEILAEVEELLRGRAPAEPPGPGRPPNVGGNHDSRIRSHPLRRGRRGRAAQEARRPQRDPELTRELPRI